MPNETRENRQTIRIGFEHILRMPLHGPDETLVQHSGRFDEAVRSDGHWRQAISEVLDGLVVQRIHLNDVFAQQCLEVSFQHDLMRRGAVRLALAVDDV